MLFISFLCMPGFPLRRVAGATSTGELVIPHGQQQFQIVLLAPHQDGTKQGRRCNYTTRPWTTSGSLSRGLASRACFTSLSLAFWIHGRTNVVVSSQLELIRHSGLCEFHSCALCREVSHQGRNEGGTMPLAPNH